MSDALMRKVQSVQNATARRITGARRRENTSLRRSCSIDCTGFLYSEVTLRQQLKGSVQEAVSVHFCQFRETHLKFRSEIS